MFIQLAGIRIAQRTYEGGLEGGLFRGHNADAGLVDFRPDRFARSQMGHHELCTPGRGAPSTRTEVMVDSDWLRNLPHGICEEENWL